MRIPQFTAELALSSPRNWTKGFEVAEYGPKRSTMHYRAAGFRKAGQGSRGVVPAQDGCVTLGGQIYCPVVVGNPTACPPGTFGIPPNCQSLPAFPHCPIGQTNCNPFGILPTMCTNLQTDSNNCGSCGNQCKNGQTCQDGACACPGGKPLNSLQNCGTCGRTCTAPSGGTASCANGSCNWVCNSGSGYSNCTGHSCTNTQSDRNNCGSCGYICSQHVPQNSTATGCTNGHCNWQCNSGYTDQSGKCIQTCPQGDTSCGGACVNLQTDRNNCGSCGYNCSQHVPQNSTATGCTKGHCNWQCNSGFVDQNGKCVRSSGGCAQGYESCGSGCCPDGTCCDTVCMTSSDDTCCGNGNVATGDQICCGGAGCSTDGCCQTELGYTCCDPWVCCGDGTCAPDSDSCD